MAAVNISWLDLRRALLAHDEAAILDAIRDLRKDPDAPLTSPVVAEAIRYFLTCVADGTIYDPDPTHAFRETVEFLFWCENLSPLFKEARGSIATFILYDIMKWPKLESLYSRVVDYVTAEDEARVLCALRKELEARANRFAEHRKAAKGKS